MLLLILIYRILIHYLFIAFLDNSNLQLYYDNKYMMHMYIDNNNYYCIPIIYNGHTIKYVY